MHHQRGVGGGGYAARGEVHHRQPTETLRLAQQVERRANLLRVCSEFVVAHQLHAADLLHHRPHVADGLDDVTGAGLALGADHRSALADAAQRLTEVAAAADERDLEVVLPDVVLLVRGRQHFGLVDVVDADGLEYLRLDEVTDAHLRHDRDGHGTHDRLDHRRVGHAGDAAVRADVGGDALQRHDGARSGVLGYLRLLVGHHVHDDAALEHLRKACFHQERAGLFAVVGPVGTHVVPPASVYGVRERHSIMKRREVRRERLQLVQGE